MLDGKWIEGLGPLLTVVEAARLTLQARFEVVRAHLQPSMFESDRDDEHVHRLRVGTRRAGAALRIFADVLPEKANKSARKTLSSIRRAAGEARDCDVFAAQLRLRAAQASERDRPGLDFLLGLATGRREIAQEHLIEAGRKHEEQLKDIILHALKTLHEPKSPSGPVRFDELGRTMLRDLTQELNWAAARPTDDYEHLHQVRILGKQLRYVMEIFSNCFDREFRDGLYPRVEAMQEILGLANDSHVAVGRLEQLRDRLKPKWGDEFKRIQPGIDGLLRFHRRRLIRQRDAFVVWREQWQNVDVPRFAALLVPPRPTPVPDAPGLPPPDPPLAASRETADGD